MGTNSQSLEFVHDWITNPTEAKSKEAKKSSMLEKAKDIFLKRLRDGKLHEVLQDLKDNPPVIVKPVIISKEAALELVQDINCNRLTCLKMKIDRGYVIDQELHMMSGETPPEAYGSWHLAHEAVMSNSCPALRELMAMEEDGLDVTKVKSNEGWTLVHAAAYSGSTEALKIVLDAGCPADLPDIYKRTPLYWAMLCGRFLAARLLIWHKADLTAEDQWRNTPLTWANDHPDSEVGDLILRASKGEFEGVKEPSIIEEKPKEVTQGEDDSEKK